MTDDEKWRCFAACWHMIAYTSICGKPSAWYGFAFDGPWTWLADRGFSVP